jgi:hypothetical protein
MPYLRQCTPPEFAADGAGDLRGGIGRVVETGVLYRFRHGKIGHARLDHGEAVGEVDLADAVELGHAEKDAIGERQRAAGERGTGPARHHLDAFGMAEREHATHLRRGLGQHDDHGKLAISGQPIGFVGTHLALGRDHAFARHDSAKCCHDALAAGEYGLVRRGHCERHLYAPWVDCGPIAARSHAMLLSLRHVYSGNAA